MFDDDDLATLRALVDRIVPADDYPGALEAGVLEYIVHQLSGAWQAHAQAYRIGLRALNAESIALAGCRFEALSPVAQDALLRDIERNRVVTNWPIDAAAFFAAACAHTAAGFYGDPAEGGNLGAVSWRMVGFPGGSHP